MQLKYKHKQQYLLIFCLLSCLISCGPHISCEQSLQAREGKSQPAGVSESTSRVVIVPADLYCDCRPSLLSWEAGLSYDLDWGWEEALLSERWCLDVCGRSPAAWMSTVIGSSCVKPRCWGSLFFSVNWRSGWASNLWIMSSIDSFVTFCWYWCCHICCEGRIIFELR